jgi:hypothetical protein
VCFTRAGLPVGEAGDLGSLEGRVDERSHCFLIDLRGYACTCSLEEA